MKELGELTGTIFNLWNSGDRRGAFSMVNKAKKVDAFGPGNLPLE